jgi:hypothetical protein
VIETKFRALLLIFDTFDHLSGFFSLNLGQFLYFGPAEAGPGRFGRPFNITSQKIRESKQLSRRINYARNMKFDQNVYLYSGKTKSS